jgi:hypothetical protein
VSIDGGLSHVVVSPALVNEALNKADEGDKKALRSWAISKMARLGDRISSGM